MNYYTIACKPVLNQFVRFFWILESDETCFTRPYTHRTMADGCCEMIFHYRGRFIDVAGKNQPNPSFTSGIAGPAQNFSRFYINEAFGILGVYLYPYALTALFGIPASAIANQQIQLADLLGQTGREIEEQIMLATDNMERISILTAFFESQLKRNQKQNPSVFKAVNDVINSQGNIPVQDLAQKHFLSTRQFERNFKEHAGFSPKLYSRIIRFQSAISKYDYKHLSLTGIAYECGYYDQSHFIHDFKVFSGYHPKIYFNGNNEATQWKESE